MPLILVLEDNELISLMLEDWLRELGCTILGPASSAAKASALIAGTMPDAAFLDVSVSDGDCSAIADALRQRGIPLTFSTGGGNDELVMRFRGSGVLHKPYDFSGVKAAVHRMLGTVTPQP